MTNAARGFTLIELLVVVLIIGILAAVALPQYQIAVAKSRFIKAVQIAHGIKNAQERYFLENNEYAHNLSELDVDYSQVCTPINANTVACEGGIFIENSALVSAGPMELVWVGLCPGYNDGFTNCSTHADLYVYFYYDNSSRKGATSCNPRTSLGTAICKSLNL